MSADLWNVFASSESFAAIAIQRLGVAALQSTVLLTLGLTLGWLMRHRGPVAASLISRATLVLTLGALLASPCISPHSSPVVTVPLAPVRISTSLPAAPAEANWDPPASSPASVSSEPLSASAPRRGTIAPPVFFAVAWVLGSVILLARLLLAALALARLRRACDPLTEGEAFSLVSQLCASQKIMSISIRTSAAIETPFLSGILRPTLWLPSSMERDYPTNCLQAVLAHELEHWRRRDCAWLLAARIATALLWPQPLLWRLCRQMEQSSEELCDQAALVASGVVPRDYADCLLRIAESRAVRPQALAVGVISFRSTLGRRIARILNSARPALLPVKLRGALIAGLTACAVVALAAVSARTDYGWRPPAGYVQAFPLASRHGWSVGPVTYASFREPVHLMSREERRLAKADIGRFGAAADTLALSTEPGYGPPVEVRRSLEAQLAQNPHSVLARYLLAAWREQNGEMVQSRALLAQALADAPAVLAGRVQYADGRPVAGYEFGMGIDYAQNVSGTTLDDVSISQHWPVWTDEQGCFYLPVYQADCEWGGWSRRNQKGLGGPGLTVAGQIAQSMSIIAPAFGSGWCSFHTKVGVLPPMIARPYVAWSAPSPSEGDLDHPAIVTTDHLDLSWRPYPQATSYKMEMLEAYHPKPNETRGPETLMEASFDPLLHSPLFLDGSSGVRFRMRLNGRSPLMHRTSIYAMTVTAYHGDEVLAQSKPRYFTPRQGILPLETTVSAVQPYMPDGVTVDRVARQGKEIVVTGRLANPSAAAWRTLSSTRWFDRSVDFTSNSDAHANHTFRMECRPEE